ncbi:MAG: glutamate--tRNA ligase [Candidatus Bathyarchaeota archaeon]
MSSNVEIRRTIRKIALLNAYIHDGKSQQGPVIGRLVAEMPHLKTKIKELTPVIEEIVKEINCLTPLEQKKAIKSNWPELLARKNAETEKKLPPLANVDKSTQVCTRFSPNPDAPIHLGSARAIILCHEYAKMYGGRFIVRFEDTDPKKKKPELPFYESIKDDLKWLKSDPDEYFIQSDRVSIYYEHAEQLLGEGNAYICTCKSESFKNLIAIKEECPCRNLPPDEHLNRWERMLDGTYREGEAVMRIKTDIKHPNPAVRDWPAFRIINTKKHSHPRVGSKYRVWPLYNFACGIDDHLMNITHIIRGKEHLTNMFRQMYMYEHLGWKYPEAIHYGRLKIEGAFLSKSKIVKGVKDGLYKSWDDPRLATFSALRRRGITAESIRKLMIDVGPKKSDVVLSWQNLYAYNRKFLDPIANRYFFVGDMTRLLVNNMPEKITARIRLHPDHPERGLKEYEFIAQGNNLSMALWISKQDLDLLEVGGMTRLMELFNIKIISVSPSLVMSSFVSKSYEEAKDVKAPLIHWVPINDSLPCQVVMPDTKIIEGKAEGACKRLMPNDIIQFERFGFVRVDKINKSLTVYYAHR